jgi:hypothetical protein
MQGHLPGADPSRSSESLRCDLERFPEAAEFGQAQADIDDTKAGNCAANEVIQKQAAKMKRVKQKDIVLP